MSVAWTVVAAAGADVVMVGELRTAVAVEMGVAVCAVGDGVSVMGLATGGDVGDTAGVVGDVVGGTGEVTAVEVADPGVSVTSTTAVEVPIGEVGISV